MKSIVPSQSFDDMVLCDLLDRALQSAVHLWALRPIPRQRAARADFSLALTKLRERLGDEFKYLFPETTKALESLMVKIRW